MTQWFGLKKNRWNKKLFNQEINPNELMSKEHKKVCRILNYIAHLLIVISTITGCLFISAFSLVGIARRIKSSVIGLKNCAGNKKYRSINKNKKKHDKIILLL